MKVAVETANTLSFNELAEESAQKHAVINLPGACVMG
jgi:hypothetical protein